MPENAKAEIAEFKMLYGNLEQGRESLIHLEMQLRAKSLAMTAAGITAPDSDPDMFQAMLIGLEQESLR